MLDNIGCKWYPAVSNVFPYVCQELRWVFIGIVNRNDFYSQYPVYDGIWWVVTVFHGIRKSIRVFPCGFPWVLQDSQIPSNTIRYYMETSL